MSSELILNKLSNSRKKIVVIIFIIGGSTLLIKKFLKRKNKKTEEKKVEKQRSSVDALFFKRLTEILKIVVGPRETFYIVILTFFLVSRTFLSVAIAEIVGQNAQALVSRSWRQMFIGIGKFAAITIPAAIINSCLKYFSSILALRFRVRLSYYVHDAYLSDNSFYKACNLGGKDRINNADQRVTADITRFCEAISELYTTAFKPILDVILFTFKLASVTGWQGPAVMYGYFAFSGFLKKVIMPSFGRIIARESELEGTYRTAHQRLITNSEEIAFYHGGDREKTIINNALKNLDKHIGGLRYLKAWVGVFDGLLVKYWASIMGYISLSMPIYFGLKGNDNKSSEELTRDYIRNSQILSNLAQAVGDLVLVGNKLTTIAGYTSRVSELLEQVRHLKDVGTTPFELDEESLKFYAKGNATLQIQQSNNNNNNNNDNSNDNSNGKENSDNQSKNKIFDNPKAVKEWLQNWRARCDERARNVSYSKQERVVQGGGTYREGPSIEFHNVDIVSPEGRLLVKELNIKVSQGQHVMVTGPNGAGKSSLFRIIGELWPLHSGILVKPPIEDILFVPQKPYLVLGTLRDQIIYPHSRLQMQARGITDEDLCKLLTVVDPAGIILSNWQLDDEKDWFLAFSGGQKQRVAMARLFYHRPHYAILDECTSAVSDEVEDTIYETCAELGVTLFTVSHRYYLRKYHNYLLKFEGREGKWEWSEVPIQERRVNKLENTN
eukprot:TRINITY_DN0_c1_g1_i3.p1 TRINITY_DN0_c1_g1~~TRINITY_DN0_c1_g1_i3.p1  ORF type:complete len:725 (-),score=331.19 TRINITY_DN0_c1_g1_i3:237-2411(-)